MEKLRHSQTVLPMMDAHLFLLWLKKAVMNVLSHELEERLISLPVRHNAINHAIEHSSRKSKIGNPAHLNFQAAC